VRPVPPKGQARPVALAKDKRIETDDRVQLPRLYLVWSSPAAFAPGDAELDLAAAILGRGKSSRLYRSLVFDKKIAQDVSASQASMGLGSRLTITATAKPGHTLDELSAAIDAELTRLRADPPTAEELEGARNRQLADLYRGLDSVEQRADLLNHYEHLLGDPGAIGKDIARYRGATAASVHAAFAQVTARPKVVLRVSPQKKGGAP
jgi:predicted Zn-dependent peptidase